jgi:biopolymer transport protein ExbD
MKFTSRDQAQPEINLIPLMDVLMTVLTFFVLVSMTLNGDQTPNVQLPGGSKTGLATQSSGQVQAAAAPKLIIGLTAAGGLVIEQRPLSSQATQALLRDRLTQTPDLVILLKADRSLPYKTIAKTLNTLRQVGGNRVSLITQ